MISSGSHGVANPASPKKDDIIKLSSWKGLTFADFDKSPTTRKIQRQHSGILLAAAQKMDSGGSSTKEKQQSKTTKSKNNEKGHKSSFKKKNPLTSKSQTKKSSSKTKLKMSLLGNPPDVAEAVETPVSISDLTTATAGTQDMTETERSEDHVVIQMVSPNIVTETKAGGKDMDTILQVSPNTSLETRTDREVSLKEATQKKSRKAVSQKTKKINVKEKKTTVKTKKTGVHSTRYMHTRLQEIERLEDLLKMEREALKFENEFMSCDKEIVRYVIHQEKERTNRLASAIESLQHRMVQIEPQDLAILEGDIVERRKLHDKLWELQGMVESQTNRTRRLKDEAQTFDSSSNLVKQKHTFDGMKMLAEENKTLYTIIRDLEEKHRAERLELQKIASAKEEIITQLQNQWEQFQMASENGIGENEKTKSVSLWSTPAGPSSAKKKKVSSKGLSFKPPLID